MQLATMPMPTMRFVGTLLWALLCLGIGPHAQNARAYAPVPGPSRARPRSRPPPALRAVTERDVLDLVERAESAWAEALAARERANALGDEAERAAESAAEESRRPASEMTSIAKISDVLRAAVDAGDVLAEARDASAEADRLEERAERALARSEEALEEHLRDFPESFLGD